MKCVKYNDRHTLKNGFIDRVSDEEAAKLVKANAASYTSKSEWRAQRNAEKTA